MGLDKLFKSKAEKQTIRDLQAEILSTRIELLKYSFVLPIPSSSTSAGPLRRELEYLKAALAQQVAAHTSKHEAAHELAALREMTSKSASEGKLVNSSSDSVGGEVLQASNQGTGLDQGRKSAHAYQVIGKIGIQALYLLIAGAIAITAIREAAKAAQHLLSIVFRVFVSPGFAAIVIFIVVIVAGAFVLVKHSNNGRAVVEKSIAAQQQVEAMRLDMQRQQALSISWELSSTQLIEDRKMISLGELWKDEAGRKLRGSGRATQLAC